MNVNWGEAVGKGPVKCYLKEFYIRFLRKACKLNGVLGMGVGVKGFLT